MPPSTPESSSRDLVLLTLEVSSDPSQETRFQDWLTAVHAADVRALIDATARLSSKPGKRTRDIKAMREAVMVEIERKNSDAVVNTMQKLDASANRLTVASLALTLVSVVLAAMQVIYAVR